MEGEQAAEGEFWHELVDLVIADSPEFDLGESESESYFGNELSVEPDRIDQVNVSPRVIDELVTELDLMGQSASEGKDLDTEETLLLEF